MSRPVAAPLAVAALAVLVAGGSTRLPAQDPPAGAKRWVATEGVSSPWILDLDIKDASVTGQAMQRSRATPASPNPPFSRPFPLSNGTVIGDTIQFSVRVSTGYGGGDRMVNFRGVRHGDTIDFTRSVIMREGEAPGDGIFGEAGATAFRATLLPDGAPVPVGRLTARFPGDIVDSAPRVNVAYRGFTIDVTQINAAPNRDSLLTAIHGQLDLVEAVSLPDELHRFVKSVPMVVYDGEGTPLYAGGKIRIPSRSAFPYAGSNPIFLHELCHAIEDKTLPGGFQNPDILTLFAAAKSSGRFPADAYMLSRPGEYFAVMASVYLHGTVDQEPYARDSIRVKQPAMYDWLVKEFGRQP